jgi:hypothetical protein
MSMNTYVKIGHAIVAIVKVFGAREIRHWIKSIFFVPDYSILYIALHFIF